MCDGSAVLPDRTVKNVRSLRIEADFLGAATDRPVLCRLVVVSVEHRDSGLVVKEMIAHLSKFLFGKGRRFNSSPHECAIVINIIFILEVADQWRFPVRDHNRLNRLTTFSHTSICVEGTEAHSCNDELNRLPLPMEFWIG